jgi:hypothetical protein
MEVTPMPSGGARPRSGPQRDPNSGASDRRRAAAKKAAAAKKKAAAKKATSTSAAEQTPPELAITSNEFNPMALNPRGRAGNPPAYPLPKIVRFIVAKDEKGKPVKVADPGVSSEFRKRELDIWRDEWKKPQALAWEREPWRWSRIALYCRITAVIEAEPDSNASLVSRQRELAIEHGLTPDGMRANGWAVAPDQLAEQRAKNAAKKAPAKKAAAPVRRLRS